MYQDNSHLHGLLLVDVYVYDRWIPDRLEVALIAVRRNESDPKRCRISHAYDSSVIRLVCSKTYWYHQ